MITITGPSGSGKTAAVYAIAYQLGLGVIEVNASSIRSGAAVTRLVGEATQSQRLPKQHGGGGGGGGKQKGGQQRMEHTLAQLGWGPPMPVGGVFSKRTTPEPSCGQKNTMTNIMTNTITTNTMTNTTTTTTPPLLSIVLFEDCDELADDEKGFAGALERMASETKCPLVIIGNTQLDAEIYTATAQATRLRFVRPMPDELVGLLRAVCDKEGVGGWVEEGVLGRLAVQCDGDIRYVVGEMIGGGDGWWGRWLVWVHYNMGVVCVVCVVCV